MILKQFIFGLFLFCAFTSTEGRAQTLSTNQQSIRGVAPGAKGREIKLFYIDNYISERTFKVASAYIDSNEKFTLHYPINQVREAKLVIDYYETTIFLEPQNSYDIVFAPFDYFQNEKINVLMNPNAVQSLAYAFVVEDSAELNQLIGIFNDAYNNFLTQEYKQILLGKGQEVSKKFISEINAQFSYSGHTYFKAYMRYQLAMLEDACKLRDKKKLFDLGIKDQPILYSNPAYMSFVKDFFYKYFNTTNYGSAKEYFDLILNASVSVEEITDSMGRDPSLVNEKLREWVSLYALYQSYFQSGLDYNTVIYRLNDIATISKFSEHIQIAKDLILAMKEQEEALFFQTINLIDIHQNPVHFVNKIAKKGKIHYVALVSDLHLLCPDCRLELATLEKISSKLDEQVQIVVINTDYYWSGVQTRKKLPWKTYNFNRDIEWLKLVKAFHLPCFIIVDDKGEVLDFKAPKPSENLIPWFQKRLNIE